MTASFRLQFAPEPILVKALSTLAFEKSNVHRTCCVDLSSKGIRFSSDHLGADQIQIYITQSAFVQFEWTPFADGNPIQLMCQISALIEGIYLCISGKQSKGSSLLELSWSENLDHLGVSSASDSYHTSIQIPTALGPGTLINKLIRDLVSSPQFPSLTLEFEPELNLLSLSSSYPNGVATIRQCLTTIGVDLIKYQTYFKFSYNKTFLMMASKIIELCKSGSIRINEAGVFSLQLMADMSNGNIYAEFIVQLAIPFPVVMSKTPADFLKAVIGHRVKVRLHSDTEYRGILVCLDGYMNIALENAQEWSGAALKQSYGEIFIRGNNVLYIQAISS